MLRDFSSLSLDFNPADISILLRASQSSRQQTVSIHRNGTSITRPSLLEVISQSINSSQLLLQEIRKPELTFSASKRSNQDGGKYSSTKTRTSSTSRTTTFLTLTWEEILKDSQSKHGRRTTQRPRNGRSFTLTLLSQINPRVLTKHSVSS